MSDHPPLATDALARLRDEWLALAVAQVREYLATNGNEPPEPVALAAACPALLGSTDLAGWALQEGSHVPR